MICSIIPLHAVITLVHSCTPDIGGILFSSTEEMVWPDAIVYCASRGAILANGNPNSVWNLVPDLGGDVWMGLTKVSPGGACTNHGSCKKALKWYVLNH